MPSAAFELVRNSKVATLAWGVRLDFPSLEGSSPFTRFYGSTGFYLNDTGETYTSKLPDFPKGRSQTGRGNDYAEFSATDTDHGEYTLFRATLENLIEKCEVTIRKCYMTALNYWESEIVFFGYLSSFIVDDTDGSLKFTALGDLSRSGFLVGGRVITREKCGTDFNYLGLLSTSDSVCGWQTSQGGPSTVCSKLYNDAVNGCLAHNNQHRFYAVPGISSAEVTSTAPPGGGFDPPPDPWDKCFSEKTYVLLADWSIKPIHKIERGDCHMGFDMREVCHLIDGNVLDTQKSQTNKIGIARFDSGVEFEVKPSHLFYLGAGLFSPVAFLTGALTLGMDHGRNAAKSKLLGIDISQELLWVYNLFTSTDNFIVTNETRDFYYFVHNSKPPLEY